MIFLSKVRNHITSLFNVHANHDNPDDNPIKNSLLEIHDIVPSIDLSVRVAQLVKELSSKEVLITLYPQLTR
jgi:hypothetical protein